jgi:hypothetical protein
MPRQPVCPAKCQGSLCSLQTRCWSAPTPSPNHILPTCLQSSLWHQPIQDPLWSFLIIPLPTKSVACSEITKRYYTAGTNTTANVDVTLKQQILCVVNRLYLHTPQHQHIKFANVAKPQLIRYLLQTYLAQPIKTLFSLIEDSINFANTRQSTYTTAQAIANVYS